jgi:death-on-curing protein
VAEPRFLTLAEVLYLHGQLIRRFGGTHGIRDPGLVESAMASAKNTYLYGSGDLFEVAVAYAFHLAESQPFLDGNKRVGAAAALSLLRKNGYPVLEDDGTLYDGMIAIAKKHLDKVGLAAVLRRLLPRKN